MQNLTNNSDTTVLAVPAVSATGEYLEFVVVQDSRLWGLQQFFDDGGAGKVRVCIPQPRTPS